MSSLSAPYTVEFPFQRTVGPKVGTFLGGLRDARLFGVVTPSGVRCPPLEFDPVTGASTGELVELEPTGSVVTWTRLPAHEFAWALIAVDGTVGTLLHTVEPDGLRVGLRVRARWRPSRVGAMTDIECFEAVP
jgi:uncharacterized OB-fold protein